MPPGVMVPMFILPGLAFAIAIASFSVFAGDSGRVTITMLKKPTVEIMAALPSVVIGFVAGLYLAPLVERVRVASPPPLDPAGLHEPGIWVFKLMLILVDFFVAFFSFSLAVRGYNHVGFLINVPTAPSDGHEGIGPGITPARVAHRNKA